MRKIALTRIAIIFAVGAALGFPTSSLAANPSRRGATKPNALALKPEVLGAKAFLEDLLARRYAQELATQVDRPSFSLGAQLELTEVPPQAPKAPKAESDPEVDTPSDLLLGTLDPDELLKKYATPEVSVEELRGFLKNYRIRSVTVSVGLKDSLAAEVKTEVEKWLTQRLSSEFGKAGKGSVTLIKSPVEKKAPPAPAPEPKTMWDWLNQFQSLAGQVVLALAIFLGLILWKLMSASEASRSENAGSVGHSSSANGGSPSSYGTADAVAGASAGATARQEKERDLAASIHASEEISKLTRRLTELTPKIGGKYELMIRTWCRAGEEGALKLACFAEAVGKEIGKLPLPSESIQALTKVFTSMPELPIARKLDALRKVYWDVLMAINLGPETFEQPFNYIGGLKVGMINQVLMDQNAKMKTLVTLHMPQDLRASFLKTQNAETKRNLLLTAAQLSEIAADELKSLDGQFQSRLDPMGQKDIVPLGMGLNKIVTALSPIEEVMLLGEMTGGAFEAFKRTTPSLAFLPEWSDAMLARLFSRAMPDEVVAYLRTRPDMRERALPLLPQMTAEVAADELDRKETTNESDRNRLLASFTERLREMVEHAEINLEEVFASAPGRDMEVQDEIRRAS